MPKRKTTDSTGIERFIQCYKGNIKEAAKEAKISYGYARRIVTKGNTLEKAQEKMTKRADKLEIKQEQVLKEYKLIGFSDIKDYMDIDNPFFKKFDELPEGLSRAIESVQIDRFTKTDKDGNSFATDKIKFKLWSKTNALEMIARHTGGFVEKKKHEFDEDKPLKIIWEDRNNGDGSPKS